MYSYISQKASGAQAKLFKMLNLNILNYWNVSKHLKMLSSCSFLNKWNSYNTDLFRSFSQTFVSKTSSVLWLLTDVNRKWTLRAPVHIHKCFSFTESNYFISVSSNHHIENPVVCFLFYIQHWIHLHFEWRVVSLRWKWLYF